MSMISIVFSGLIVTYSISVEKINPPFTKAHLNKKTENRILMVEKDSLNVSENYPATSPATTLEK